MAQSLRLPCRQLASPLAALLAALALAGCGTLLGEFTVDPSLGADASADATVPPATTDGDVARPDTGGRPDDTGTPDDAGRPDDGGPSGDAADAEAGPADAAPEACV